MDKLDALKNLKQLFDDGALSEKEFVELKKSVLNNTVNHSTIEPGIKEIQKKENANIKPGTLRINFKGAPALWSFATKLYINNLYHSTLSTKKGFTISIPIPSKRLTIKLIWGELKTTSYELEELEIGKNYYVELLWDRSIGSYSNECHFSGHAIQKAIQKTNTRKLYGIYAIVAFIVIGGFNFFSSKNHKGTTQSVQTECSHESGSSYNEGYSIGKTSGMMGGTSDCNTYVESYNYELGRNVLQANDCFCEGYSAGYNAK